MPSEQNLARRDARRYDPRSIEKIMRERGVDANEAMQIACTSLEGAYETPGGGISSFQTACNVLGYSEDLPESAGAKEGKRKTSSDLNKLFSQYGIDAKAIGYDAAVDLLMKKMGAGT